MEEEARGREVSSKMDKKSDPSESEALEEEQRTGQEKRTPPFKLERMKKKRCGPCAVKQMQ